MRRRRGLDRVRPLPQRLRQEPIDLIDAHYSEQLAALGDSDPELSASIARFQADEREHRDIALAAGAEAAPGYPLLYSAIRAGCRIAIELSKRI